MAEYKLERANPAVELRLIGEHQVAYALIGPEGLMGLEIPSILRSQFVRIISNLPKSGLQLLSPSWYQCFHLERGSAQPVRFGVIFEQNFSSQAEFYFDAPALLHVLGWMTTEDRAIAALSKIKAPWVLVPLGPTNKDDLTSRGIPPTRIAETQSEVLRHIERRTEGIAKSEQEYLDRKAALEAVAKDWRDRVLPGPLLPFFPLGPNEAQIRQMLGQFGEDFWSRDSANPRERRPFAQAEAFRAVLDTNAAVAGTHSESKPLRLAPPAAILVFPSISPILKTDLEETLQEADPTLRPSAKEIIAGRLAEQDSTTFVSFPKTAADSPEKMVAQIGLQELAYYTRFLDDMGYLHGSFHCAPYLRAPVKGSSLAQHHSFFAPANFPRAMKPGPLRRKIDLFSQTLRGSLHTEMHKVISEYPGQIVAISDLPIEWLESVHTPLAFSHDVCRIPETGATNLLSQFNQNSHSSFTVSPGILSRTLVVCGAPSEDPIAKSFELLTEQWKERGVPWRWEHCLSRDKLVQIVNEFRPELLVFDTHGGFRSNEVGTELQFGSETLDGNDVIAHFPQVPLVMLSTCWGAPLYGNPNTIAHAFFEVGSFAVTTSMLPLDVVKGSTMYYRVLNNLERAVKTALHPNWSSFLSHNVRTSLFDDMKAALPARSREKLVPLEDYVRIRSEWQAKTMLRGMREEAYLSTAERVLDCFTSSVRSELKAVIERREFVPEFMFYSTMGRADLIGFAAWNEKFYRPQEKQLRISDLLRTESGMAQK